MWPLLLLFVVLPPRLGALRCTPFNIGHIRLEVLPGSGVKQRSGMQAWIAHAGFALCLKVASKVESRLRGALQLGTLVSGRHVGSNSTVGQVPSPNGRNLR